MIYISAQPDEAYFLWQLELQIFNFHSKGILNNQIQILVGYNPTKGLHPAFKTFADQHMDVNIYFYPDTRIHKKYLSSLRPHLLAKHYHQYPELEAETIFYHDSDILLTQVPNWEILTEDDTWYVSDTRSYLDSKYIRQFMDESEFSKICSILSIDPEEVKAHDQDAGGAQYILKRCTAAFWEKVETDCERLFSYLYFQQKYGTRIHKDFQIWCTDMWVIWWNTLLLKQDFRIHPLLNFSWADSPIQNIKQTVILHYTGRTRKDIFIFDKTRYQTHAPFYSDLSQIDYNTCSKFVADTIRAYRKLLDDRRCTIPDTAFLIPFTQDDIHGPSNIETIRKYYLRYWNVDIILTAQKEMQKYIDQSVYKHILVIQSKWIIPVREMQGIMKNLQITPAGILSYPIKIYQMDPLGIHIFSEILDNDYLEENQGKTIPRTTSAELTIYNMNGTNRITNDKTVDIYGL